MNAKYTPGPWTAHDDDGTGTLPCVLSDKVNAGGSFYVAQCNVFADAVLISAAPDLLEACRYVVKYHREHDSGEGELFGLDFVTTCIAAIDKAEGN